MPFIIDEFVFKMPGIESPAPLLGTIGEKPAERQFVNYDANKSLGKSRHLSAATKLLSSTATKLLGHKSFQQAIESAPTRVGIFIAENNVNLKDDFDFDLCAKTHGPDHVSPLQAPNTLANVVGSHFARISSIEGPNSTVSAGQHGVYHALDMAELGLQCGAIDTAIVGAVNVTSCYHKILQHDQREVCVAARLSRAHGDAAVTLYPPLMRTLPDIDEEKVARLIALQARKHLKHSDVDMVWIANGLSQLDPDRFTTVLTTKKTSHCVVSGKHLFGNEGHCDPLILTCLAHEMFMEETTDWSRLGKAMFGPAPERTGTIAIISCDEHNQLSVLIMVKA